MLALGSVVVNAGLAALLAAIAILTLTFYWLLRRRHIKRTRIQEARSAFEQEIAEETERAILELREVAETQMEQHRVMLETAMGESIVAWTAEIESIEGARIRESTAAMLESQHASELEAAIGALRDDAAEHLKLAEEKIDADAKRKIAAAATMAEEKARTEIFRLMAETERNTAAERDAIMLIAQKEIAEAHAEVRAAAREMLDFERVQLEEIARAREAFAVRMKHEWDALERGSQEELERMKLRLDAALADGKQRLEDIIVAEMESELQQRRASMIAAIDEQLESERTELRRQTVASINQERAHMQAVIRRFGAEREKLARITS
jgi:hypothetical protein